MILGMDLMFKLIKYIHNCFYFFRGIKFFNLNLFLGVSLVYSR